MKGTEQRERLLELGYANFVNYCDDPFVKARLGWGQPELAQHMLATIALDNLVNEPDDIIMDQALADININSPGNDPLTGYFSLTLVEDKNELREHSKLWFNELRQGEVTVSSSVLGIEPNEWNQLAMATYAAVATGSEDLIQENLDLILRSDRYRVDSGERRLLEACKLLGKPELYLELHPEPVYIDPNKREAITLTLSWNQETKFDMAEKITIEARTNGFEGFKRTYSGNLTSSLSSENYVVHLLFDLNIYNGTRSNSLTQVISRVLGLQRDFWTDMYLTESEGDNLPERLVKYDSDKNGEKVVEFEINSGHADLRMLKRSLEKLEKKWYCETRGEELTDNDFWRGFFGRSTNVWGHSSYGPMCSIPERLRESAYQFEQGNFQFETAIDICCLPTKHSLEPTHSYNLWVHTLNQKLSQPARSTLGGVLREAAQGYERLGIDQELNYQGES